MVADCVGQELLDIRGEKIGKIERVLAEGDAESKWAVVKVGILGMHSTLVPLDDAEAQDGAVRVVYEKDHVKNAPEVEVDDDDQISSGNADVLHGYYGLERVTGLAAPNADDDIDLSRETREAEPPGMKEGPDSPLTKRRRQRAEELGVPSANEDGDAEPEVKGPGDGEAQAEGDKPPEGAEKVDVDKAPLPTTELPESDAQHEVGPHARSD